MQVFFILLFLQGYNANICDLFVHALCPFVPGNIVGTISQLSSEQDCQKKCQDFVNTEDLACRNFTFFPYSQTPTECYLFQSCDVTTACNSCTSGPANPDIPEECISNCSSFQNGRCDLDFNNLLDIEEPVDTASTCQKICREKVDCSLFSFDANTEICYLFLRCTTVDECPLCTTGPPYPDIESCENIPTTPVPTSQPGDTLALALGGFMASEESGEYFSGSTEIFNGVQTCSIHIGDIDLWSGMVVNSVGGNITACGGYDRTRAGYSNKCWHLDLEERRWHLLTGTLPYAASRAGTIVLEGKMMIFGGTNGGVGPWVQEYESSTDTWTESFNMPESKYGHCVVNLDDEKIFVFGGFTSKSVDSAHVLTPGPSSTWTVLPVMENARDSHTCLLWEHRGHRGILVVGGQCSGNLCNHGLVGPFNSVEFYNIESNRWETLYDSFLTKPRYGHGMSVLGGVPMVYGGWFNQTQVLASGERLEGETWVEVENVLSTGRAYFGYTQIENDLTSCF